MAEIDRTRRQKIDDSLAGMSRAGAVLQMLVHVFGGDADTDNPSETPGIGFTIQGVTRMLREVEQELMNLDSGVADAYVIVVEARAMTELIDHLIFNNDQKIRMSDDWLCNYFDAIDNHVKKAAFTLERVTNVLKVA